MKEDWTSCNGNGRLKESGRGDPRHWPPTRRQFLVGGAVSSIWWFSKGSALADLAIQKGKPSDTEVLVNIFLRGGADGLSIVAPFGEDGYHRLRPTLRLASPKNRQADVSNRLIDLDGFFGLNPNLSALLPLYRSGNLSFIHAVGSLDQSRSHFEAMSAMERGLADNHGSVASGWLARYLAVGPVDNRSPLRAVAFSQVMPDSLRGATHATAISSLADYKLVPPLSGSQDAFTKSLSSMYAAKKDEIAEAGMETLDVLKTLNNLDPAKELPHHNARYPNGELGEALRQIAFLVRANVGLEIACVDKGGWDTHFVQGAGNGLMAGILRELGGALSAFWQDLGRETRRVTVCIQTEFGRRVYENQSLGTDHGRGSVMLVLGQTLKCDRVLGVWPGLEEHQLEGPGDLRVTTDYRTVLSEILDKRLRCEPAAIFPGFKPQYLGLMDHAF